MTCPVGIGNCNHQIRFVEREVIVAAIPYNNVATGKEYQEGPRYASLRGIMKAKKKPIDKLSLEDLGVDQTLQVRAVKFTQPPARSAGVIVESVQELVQKLRDEAKVL